MKTAKEMFDVMVAYENGLPIEALDKIHGAAADWLTTTIPNWNWGEFDYRVKMVTPVIPWEIIDKNWTHFAIDADGSMYFYNKEPAKHSTSWWPSHNEEGVGYTKVNGLFDWLNTLHWEQTLQSRPE